MDEGAGPSRLRLELGRIQDELSEALGIPPESRERIYRSVFLDSKLNEPFYWVCLLSSCGIATLGLAQDSPAVIIGAMLLSPLMGPILGLGLAMAIGDLYLGVKSAANCLLSTLLVVGLSGAITLFIPFQEITREIASRTQPNPLDLFIALFCGVIAAASAARSPSAGVGSALPGVAIAVALVPPLCTAGWGLGASLRWEVFAGGMLLYLTNLAAILLTSMLFFLLIRLDSPEHTGAIRTFIAEREMGKRVFAWLERHPWAGQFKRIGSLRNRILATVAAVAILFVPLEMGLKQVQRQLLTKGEVAKAEEKFLSGFTILSRSVIPRPRGAEVKLVLVEGFKPPDAPVRDMEDELRNKLGPNVTVRYTEVASGEEERYRFAALAAPPIPTLRDLVSQLKKQDYSALGALWPDGGYRILDESLVVPTGEEPVRLRVRYVADQALPPVAVEAYRRAVSRALDAPSLGIEVVQLPKTWGRLDLAHSKSRAVLEGWIQQIAASAFALPRGWNLRAILEYPRGSSERMIRMRKAQALEAIALLRLDQRLSGVPLPEQVLPSEKENLERSWLILMAETDPEEAVP